MWCTFKALVSSSSYVGMMQDRYDVPFTSCFLLVAKAKCFNLVEMKYMVLLGRLMVELSYGLLVLIPGKVLRFS